MNELHKLIPSSHLPIAFPFLSNYIFAWHQGEPSLPLYHTSYETYHLAATLMDPALLHHQAAARSECREKKYSKPCMLYSYKEHHACIV